MMRRRGNREDAVTLVELVIVLVITSIIAFLTPRLFFHGVQTMVFLPKALAVNNAATEILHQMIEGGFSSLALQPPVRGLRFAVRLSATEPALWLAEASRIGFRTADGQSILLRWDDSTLNKEVIRRSFPSPSCTPAIDDGEVIPYKTDGIVRVLQTPTIPPPRSVFRYYNQSDIEDVTPGCPVPTTIRRVDIAFTAQTGTGNFDQGNASEQITSSVAIRVP